ncbi:MAG TPA: cytochrome c biogenesis protein CcdA [Gammaproteobacteria bacterium]|nr:cytochrome c biogenesis protein CcdA [Gammaproteobacteria bacterium]
MKSFALSLFIACLPSLSLAIESKDFITLESTRHHQELTITLTAKKGYEIHPEGVEITGINPGNILRKYALSSHLVQLDLVTDHLPSNVNIHYQGCSTQQTCYAPSTTTLSWKSTPSWKVLGAKLFGLGLITAFSPCILPMVPLLLYYLSRKKTSKHTAIFSFIVGTLTAYGMIAFVFNQASQHLTHQLQTPYVLAAASLFIMLLGMLAYPNNQAWQQRWSSVTAPVLNRIQSPLLGGLLATLVLSPCATPSLATSLILTTSVSSYQAIPLMMLFALGLLTPMTVIGFTGIQLSNNTSRWSLPLQILLSFSLLFIGLDLLIKSQLINFTVSILLVGGLVTALVGYHTQYSKPLIYTLMGLTAMVSLATYHPTPTQQTLITTPLEYQRAGPTPKHQTRALFFTAKWCSLCQQLKHKEYFQKLRHNNHFQWVEIDVSKTLQAWQPFFIKNNLLGPPAILILSDNGTLIRSFTGILSEHEAQQLENLATLSTTNKT